MRIELSILAHLKCVIRPVNMLYIQEYLAVLRLVHLPVHLLELAPQRLELTSFRQLHLPWVFWCHRFKGLLNFLDVYCLRRRPRHCHHGESKTTQETFHVAVVWLSGRWTLSVSWLLCRQRVSKMIALHWVSDVRKKEKKKEESLGEGASHQAVSLHKASFSDAVHALVSLAKCASGALILGNSWPCIVSRQITTQVGSL